MTATKTIFIIPGFRHLPTNKAYKEITKMLKKEGYKIVLVTIPWKATTISENTELFLKKYNKVTTKKKYILGFSFGAMIAFLASTKVKSSGLILCSLSPYFKEDLQKVVKSSHITKKRYKDFSSLHAKTIASKVQAKQIHMLYGVNEEKILIKRVTKSYHQIDSQRKYLIPIQQTDHNIGDKRYLYQIHQIAKTLH